MTLKFGCIGDSGLDAYRGTDNRGGAYAAYTFNPIELLQRLRGFDLGAWGEYGQPRRTDYAHNWARSSATSLTMVSQGQHTGLASQITNGDVDYAWIRIGFNDHAFYNDLYGAIYDGTLSGSALADDEASRVAAITTALDALLGAGAAGVCCQLFPRALEAAAIANGYTNATNRQRVLDSIGRINAGLTAVFEDRGVAYRDPNRLVGDWLHFTSGTTELGFEWWGEWIDASSNDDEPHHALLDDNVHTGTILSAAQANHLCVELLNETYATDIRPLQRWEVLEIAGIETSVRGSVTRGG